MTSNDPVRINYTISIGIANASQKGVMKIDRAEWDGLTPDERTRYINEMYNEEVANYLDGGWDLDNATIDDPVVDA